MAETEVSKMIAIEEKCGLDMSSYQDLPKSDCNETNHHNQVNDLDNSYVFVTGVDGLPDVAVGDNDVVVGGSNVPPGREGSQIEKNGAVSDEAHHLNEGVNGNVELSNGDSNLVYYSACKHESSPENGEGVKVSATDSLVVMTWKIESSPEAEVTQSSAAVSQGLHTETTKSVAETDVKQVRDSNKKTGSMLETEVQKVVDPNEEIEGVVQGRQKDCEGVIAEPQESQVRALELVAEIGENRTSNTICLNNNSSNSPDASEDRSNTSIIEALEAQQRSEDMDVDVGEHDLKSVGVEAADETKLTRELEEVAEHEVSTSTSRGSELFSINNEDETLEEEANTDLSLDILENQKGDTLTSNIVQDMEGETDETKHVGSCSDSHVQTTCGLVLDEKSEDPSVSEVANSGQYFEESEEQPVGSSSDCRVQTTCNLVLEDKNEGLLVSEVENGTQYHEESKEQHVGSSSDSHVQLDLEEQNEDSSVFEVDDGTRYHEESQEQHVGSGSDSHVQTTCDFVIEEKDGGSSVSEANNGAQYHEENKGQPVANSDAHVHTRRELHVEEKDVGSYVSEADDDVKYHEVIEDEPVSSSNSHVQTTRELDLEEKVEASSVSEVDNAAQYHEESYEQPVRSINDSPVQTTCGLILEETHEDSSASKAENGAHYEEESLEQSVVCSTGSQAQTTCDLASEGNNDVSSVSEVESGAQYHEESQEQPLVSSTSDLSLEEKDEDASVSEVENGSKSPNKSQEQSDGCGASHDMMPLETVTEASLQSQSGTEVPDVEEIGMVFIPPVSGLESQVIKKVVPVFDSAIRCTPDEASSESDCALDMVVPVKEIALEGGNVAHSQTEVSSDKLKVGDSSPESLGIKLEPGSDVDNSSVRITGGKSDDLAVSCRPDTSDSFSLNSDAAANIALEVGGVGDMVDKSHGATGNSKENLSVAENENTGVSQNEAISVASTGVSTMNTSDGEDKNITIKTKPFNFLVRTPRFDDESLREQIRLAKLQVDEKTKLRDSIQLQIQEKRANSQINGIDYEFSKGEGRSARKLVRSKRMEIDSLQSVINKAKNALSIEDIDSQIHSMEHMIQHETLPLKEEKQLIREIKQLRQLREQLSSNMGSQDEIKQALEQKEEIEERLKILRKELDVLKNRVLQAEATAAEAQKKYDDENRKVKELQAQFRAADEVRQAAYAQWQNLRKELSKKSKYFFKYKDDAAVASNYAFSRDTEALYRLCTNQVGNFMELWNTNPEFRKDYVKFNARSNIRRFGTLDCRSLGPDEEPPAKPSFADERGNRMTLTPAEVDLAPQLSSVELKQKTPSENVTSNSKSIKKVTEAKSQKVPDRPAINIQVNGFDAHTRSGFTDEVHEEPIKSKDEIESMRKAEEMRKEKDEAKLKEQRRLEALEKANEARERKKRQAEKLQQRVELKTQKEAEQREKEREKRLRKKERKKAGMTDANDANNNCETAPSSESAAENSKDLEVKDMPPAVAKKHHRPWLVTKQSKTKSIPPPLRNRNKKKLQQWMWVGITSFIILVLFWLGNIGVFSNVALKRRAPVY